MGMYFCTEVAYYSYLFAKIKNKEHYEIATGCAKAGSLSGQCASGLIGQLVVTLSAKNDYSTLPYLSLAGTTKTERVERLTDVLSFRRHDVRFRMGVFLAVRQGHSVFLQGRGVLGKNNSRSRNTEIYRRRSRSTSECELISPAFPSISFNALRIYPPHLTKHFARLSKILPSSSRKENQNIPGFPLNCLR